jgi:hypothetical protein
MTEQQMPDALLNFRSQADSPRFRPDPPELRELAQRLRVDFSTPHLGEDFSGHLREAIVGGLYRLDAVPRDDPFWNGPNRRPTLGNLFVFAHYSLQHHRPREQWAWWVLAAMSVLWRANDFGLPSWEGLRALGRLDFRWPVYAAFHVRASSSYDPAPALIRFLNESRNCLAARTALESLEGQGPRAADWAKSIARACPVAVDPAWLAWNDGTPVRVARAIAEGRRFGDLPILADALEEAGCKEEAILSHCRQPGPHGRACWVVDLFLEKG